MIGVTWPAFRWARLGRVVLFLASTVTLYAGFSSNRWNVADSRWFDRFQQDTQSFVVGRMVQTRQDGWLSFGGLLGWGNAGMRPDESFEWHQYLAYEGGWSFATFEPYLSQPGGSGALFGALDSLLPGPSSEKLQFFHDLTSLLSALALSLIVLWFALEFGFVVSIVVLVSTLASQWLVVFGRNLYWSIWVFYLPLIGSLYWLRRNVGRQSSPAAFGALALVVLLAKCLLTGYEYLTTTLVMLAVPVVYYGLRDGWSPRRAAGLLAAAAVGSAIAIGAAALLLTLQIAAVRGSWMDGLDHILLALRRRSLGDPTGLAPEFADSLRAPMVNVLLGYLRGRYFDFNRLLTVTDPFLVRYVLKFRYLYLIGVFLVASILVWRPRRGNRAWPARRSGMSLVAVAWFSLLAPLSWFVLFKAHSNVHTHMNFIVWQMPFTMFAFAVVGRWLGDLGHRARPRPTAEPPPPAASAPIDTSSWRRV